MAARGTDEKIKVRDTILATFNGAFMEDDKIIRVPINGLEIKISLTCAKDVIGGGAAQRTTGPAEGDFDWSDEPKAAPALAEPTAEEIQNIRNIMQQLNL